MLRNVEQWWQLLAEHLHTAYGFLLRRRWLLLGDDSGELLRHLEQWRFLLPEYLHPARHGFLLRPVYRLPNHDPSNLHDAEWHVDEWRLLHARSVRRWVNRRVLLLWRRTLPSVVVWRLHDFWRHVSGRRHDLRRCWVLRFAACVGMV